MAIITNLCIVQSLKQIVINKVLVTLFNQQDVRRELTKNLLYESYVLHNSDLLVKEKVKCLQIPDLIKEDILHHIYPIGKHIRGWVRSHIIHLNTDDYLPREFSWTCYGTIHGKKTAQTLVNEKSFSISTCFELACTYCLENEIHLLWERMPGNLKEHFSNVSFLSKPFVAFWINEIHRREAEADSKGINEILEPSAKDIIYAFRSATKECNVSATKFFLEQLTVWERNFLLEDAVPEVLNSLHFQRLGVDILRMLFSEMQPNQKNVVFQSHAVAILESFLDWPNNDYLFEIIAQMWDYLSEEKYCKLLGIVAEKVQYSSECTSINFSELFVIIWQKGTTQYQKYAIREGSSYFGEVFKRLREHDICLILNDLDVHEKTRFIFSNHGRSFCRDLHMTENYSILMLFFRKCFENESVALEFKKALLEDQEVFGSNRHFLNFCDEFISELKKNNVVQESTSSGNDLEQSCD